MAMDLDSAPPAAPGRAVDHKLLEQWTERNQPPKAPARPRAPKPPSDDQPPLV